MVAAGMTVQPWRDKAACRGMETNLFFPERGDNTAIKQAIEVCYGCEVRLECLAFAMQFLVSELPGIWGGKSHRQRRRLRWEMDRTWQ